MKIASVDHLLVAQTYALRRPAADARLAARAFARALGEASETSDDRGSNPLRAEPAKIADAGLRETVRAPRPAALDRPPAPGSYLDLRV